MIGIRGLFHVDSESKTTEMHDCGAVLRSLRSLIPDGLVGSLEWERLAGRADGLSASSELGLEFQLGNRNPNADFLLGFLPGSKAEQAHVRQGHDAPPDSPQAVLANYFARVRSAEFPEAALIAKTILEYDMGLVAGDADAPPAVFQCLNHPSSRNSGIRDAEIAGRIASELSCAVGRSDDAREIATIRRVVAALPPGWRLTWMGAMPGRDPRMIRLMIVGVDAGGLVDDLQRIGWPGPTEIVSSILDALNDQFNRLAIQLEVSAQGTLPRLGIEVYVLPERSPDGFQGRSTAATPDRWRPVLSRLENAGWCLPLKAGNLLEFPGREYLFDDGIFLVHKGINHIKIALEAGQACTAKAYGSMLFLPVNA